MYENLMEEVVSPENYGKALRAVICESGRAGNRRNEGDRVERTPSAALAEIHGKLMAGPIRRAR